MGVPTLSSGAACLLLWVFVVRSVQASVPALATRPYSAESTASSVVPPLPSSNAADIRGVARLDEKSPPKKVTAEQVESKVDQNRVTVEDGKVPHIRESAKKPKDNLYKEKDITTNLVTDVLQQVSSPMHSQMEQQLKNYDRPSDSGKKLPISTAVPVALVKQSHEDKDDVVKDSAHEVKVDDHNTANNLQKSEAEKNLAEKHVQNSEGSAGGNQPNVNPKAQPTTVKEATKGILSTLTAPPQTGTHGTKSPLAQPSQGQVHQKNTDASPGQTKYLGGVPPASSPGNLDYGNARQPDSEEELEPPLPSQKDFSVASGSASLGAQPIVDSVGGNHPEKPLDASGAAGSMPSLPTQDDSHFFAYFLTAVVLCVVGYLAFHNKRKILALILEGRHERQRRHNGHYRRLDNTDEASSARKSRGSF